jgi:hypothetical protein
MQNSMTSPFVWGYALVPAIWAVSFPLDTKMLVVGFLLSATLYWLLYLRLTQFNWCFTPLTGRTRLPHAAKGPEKNINESAEGLHP